MPAELTKATIKPILKDPLESHLSPSNYRPISLVHALSKVYELLLGSFITQKTSSNQYAYKTNSSTLDCYYRFRKDVLKTREEYGQAIVCYVDLSKAFDTLPYQEIIDIFSQNPATPNYITRSVVNYITKTEFIIAEGLTIKPTKGIKQGGVISPQLFCHCVDPFLRTDFSKYGPRTRIYGFADDFVIIGHSVTSVQAVLSDFQAFCDKTGLTPNPKKTKVQFFTEFGTRHLPTLKLCGVTLEIVRKFKYLGIMTDTVFGDKIHMDMILSKFRKAVMIFKKMIFTKNKTLLFKILRTYTISKMYGLEMISPESASKHQRRYEYILAIALDVPTTEIENILNKSENQDLRLDNMIKKANDRMNKRL